VLIKADFGALNSHTVYPYVDVIRQQTTEQILAKQVEERGIKIIRGFCANGLQDSPDGLVVNFENGQNIVARYVIAADGSKSISVGRDPISSTLVLWRIQE